MWPSFILIYKNLQAFNNTHIKSNLIKMVDQLKHMCVVAFFGVGGLWFNNLCMLNSNSPDSDGVLVSKDQRSEPFSLPVQNNLQYVTHYFNSSHQCIITYPLCSYVSVHIHNIFTYAWSALLTLNYVISIIGCRRRSLT